MAIQIVDIQVPDFKATPVHAGDTFNTGSPVITLTGDREELKKAAEALDRGGIKAGKVTLNESRDRYELVAESVGLDVHKTSNDLYYRSGGHAKDELAAKFINRLTTIIPIDLGVEVALSTRKPISDLTKEFVYQPVVAPFIDNRELPVIIPSLLAVRNAMNSRDSPFSRVEVVNCYVDPEPPGQRFSTSINMPYMESYPDQGASDVAGKKLADKIKTMFNRSGLIAR